ncbi:hypothetical protein AB1Y20_012501 [Prymnesium parvum]|uniref:Uncharacterized protein n=1 Tax=Prymnesium parvum TaxID=97485 RepID=A0AB34IKV4_PRYPA
MSAVRASPPDADASPAGGVDAPLDAEERPLAVDELEEAPNDVPSDVEEAPELTVPPNNESGDEEVEQAAEEADVGAPARAGSARPSKYTWAFASSHTFTSRAKWEGAEYPRLAPHLAHLTTASEPHEFFQAVDAPEEEYTNRARHSELYRTHRKYFELDGQGVACYEDAANIEYADMRYLDAAVLLHGLDPAVSREKQFVTHTLAVKGHRVADLFDEKRYKCVRKFHHPGDIRQAKQKGHPLYDNLHQVAPMLDSLAAVGVRAVVPEVISVKLAVSSRKELFE